MYLRFANLVKSASRVALLCVGVTTTIVGSGLLRPFGCFAVEVHLKTRLSLSKEHRIVMTVLGQHKKYWALIFG